MKKALKIERLTELRKCMQKVPVRKFYIGTWFTRYFKEPVKVNLPDNFIRFDCRSAACSMGFAGLHKPFRKLGLKTILGQNNVYYTDATGRVYAGIEAGMAFFGIKKSETRYLFLALDYHMKADTIKPRHVIERIEALIEKISR